MQSERFALGCKMLRETYSRVVEILDNGVPLSRAQSK